MSEAPADNSARLDALEMRVAHQDRVIAELNEVITAQWRKIDVLERLLANPSHLEAVDPVLLGKVRVSGGGGSGGGSLTLIKGGGERVRRGCGKKEARDIFEMLSPSL